MKLHGFDVDLRGKSKDCKDTIETMLSTKVGHALSDGEKAVTFGRLRSCKKCLAFASEHGFDMKTAIGDVECDPKKWNASAVSTCIIENLELNIVEGYDRSPDSVEFIDPIKAEIQKRVT